MHKATIMEIANSTETPVQYIHIPGVTTGGYPSGTVPVFTHTGQHHYHHLPTPHDCMLFAFVLDTMITGFLCLMGFIGSGLSFVVLWQEKNHASITFLLEALVIADMAVIWMVFIEDVIPGLAFIIPFLRNCTYVCTRIGFVTRPLRYLAQTCVVWFTLSAAINRYVVACSPSHASLVCTLEFARKEVVLILVGAVAITVPLTFDTTLKVTYKPGDLSPQVTETLVNNVLYHNLYVNGVIFIILYLLPLSCIAYLCGKLIQVLHNIKRLRRALANVYKTQNTEMTQVILTLCITLFVCYTPSLIRCIIHWTQTEFIEICGQLNYYLDSFCKMFHALNSSMKFIIFCLFTQKFWETLKKTFCRKHLKSPTDLEIFGMYKCSDMSEMTLISHVEHRP